MILKRVPYLATVGNIATMLGLLGTVYGLIVAFQGLGDARWWSGLRACRMGSRLRWPRLRMVCSWGFLLSLRMLFSTAGCNNCSRSVKLLHRRWRCIALGPARKPDRCARSSGIAPPLPTPGRRFCRWCR